MIENAEKRNDGIPQQKQEDVSQDLYNNFENEEYSNYIKLEREFEREKKEKNRKTAQRRKELSWKNRRWSKWVKKRIDNQIAFSVHYETINRITDKLSQLIKDGNIITLFKTYNIELKEVGINYRGYCPRHQEKTPSLSISRSKNVAKCFWCGHWGELWKVIFELEFWKGIRHKIRRMLQLEQKIDSFLWKENISQYKKILEKKQQYQENQSKREKNNTEESDFPF